MLAVRSGRKNFKKHIIMMNKLNILYMLISTIFTFVSCTRVKNKDLKVNILALTESESVYFIQKADTIEYKSELSQVNIY